jgi:hypothetical protein
MTALGIRTQIKINADFMLLNDKQLSQILVSENVRNRLMNGTNKYLLSGVL